VSSPDPVSAGSGVDDGARDGARDAAGDGAGDGADAAANGGPAGQPSWPEVLTALTGGQELPRGLAGWAFGEILAGRAAPSQIAGLAVGLAVRGETAAEIGALADAMLAHAVRITVAGRTLDVVGTGGDRAGTVNVSTMAAIVAAAAGARVVKHGNRAASSRSGSADTLEALGVALTPRPERVVEIAEQVGITFCMAQAFHPALRHAAPVRRELGIRTFFNALGPLTNPAGPDASLVGVADRRMAALMADVFAARGVAALVVHGDDGLDELTTTTTSTVWVVNAGSVRARTVDPTAFGIARAAPGDLRGGDALVNAGIVRSVLDGARGPVRDIVMLNAAAALAAESGFEGGLEVAIAGGLRRAAAAVDSGRAAQLLTRWAAASRS